MNSIVRNKLDMVTRVRTFSRAHPSTEPTYTTVLGRLEERLAEAQAIATRQHEASAAARGARNNRKELRRIVHFQLLKYLVAVGSVAAKTRAELATQFRLPSVGANNQAFLTAVKALVAAAEQQREVLVAAGMAPALLELRVLDGINRWRFAKDPEAMAEWEAARHLPPSRPANEPVKVKEVTPPSSDAGRIAPAA